MYFYILKVQLIFYNMTNRIYLTFLLPFFLLISCNQTITTADIDKINGYWEIEKVILADGTKKEYRISETIDYFKIKDNKGFRKKVVPQLDGSYLINNQFENIAIVKDKDLYYIKYTTKYTKFKEQIVQIRDSILVLKNAQNVEYHYKKPIPFSVK